MRFSLENSLVAADDVWEEGFEDDSLWGYLLWDIRDTQPAHA